MKSYFSLRFHLIHVGGGEVEGFVFVELPVFGFVYFFVCFG